MNKYIKKFLIITISLVTVVSICISTVLMVGANANDDIYGTQSGGIKSDADTLLTMTPVLGIQNGDFSEGLKYWGGVDGCTDPSTVATIISENNNNYLHIDTSNVSTDYQGIISVPFKISGVEVGDYVGVRLKYRSSDTNTTSIRIGLAQNNYYRSAYKACNSWYSAPTADGEWKTLVTTATENGGTLKAVTLPENGSDIFFMLRITANGKDIVCDIDDIEFVKFTDGTGTSFESISYGTAEEGIILSSANKTVSSLAAIDEFNNFDFANGLVNFGPRDTWTGFWKKLPDIGIKTENGKLRMAFTTDANANNDYPGIRSVNVKIPDSAKGKKIFLNFDAASNQDFAVRIIVDGVKHSWVWIRNYHYGTDITTPILKNVTAKENFSGVTIGENASEIAVEIQAENKTDKCIYIDNIKFIYFDGNATNGSFTDLVGNNYDKDGVLVEDSNNDEEDLNDTYGTETEGIKQSINPRELPATDVPNNLDFSKGFKYWGSSRTSFKTTDAAKLVTESSNTYVQLTPNTSYDSGWGGIISAPFYLDVKPGATLSLLYDWKGSSDYIVKLVQQNVSQAGADIKCDGSSGTIIKSATTENGWNTSWQNIKNSVVEDSMNDNLYSFYIYIQPNGEAEITPDTCFDNIRIIQVSGTGSETVLYDLEGNLIILDNESDYDDEYGTKADGIDISKDPRKLSPIDSPPNLDFSEGFRYWGTQESNFKASDAAKLKVENGDTHIQLTPDPSYAEGWGGITSVPFYLDVKEGTTLTLLYDWKGDPNVLLKLVQCQLPDGKTSKKCDAGPTTNMLVIGETDEDWNTSWNYTFDPVLADDTDDGKYCFYIFIQPSAGADPLQDTCFDNIRIVSVDGVGDSAKLYDLDGNLLSFGEDDEDEDDYTEDDSSEDDYDSDSDSSEDDYDSDSDSTVSDNTNNSSNSSNSSNASSNTNSNYNANQSESSGNSANNWSGLVNADTIDITEAMEQIYELNSGETVDFITLFNLDTSNGGINAYISVKTLNDNELKALKAMTEQQLKNTAITLRAILSTMVGSANTENAKAFIKLGGNPSNTLPLSFTGHINLDFTVNIRIKMASGSLSASKTYYAYHCNPDTRVIDNLGKVYLEEQDGNTYITIRTNSFSDFFISPDNLKAQANTDADVDNTETNNIVLWAVIGSAALILIVATVVIIILNKRKKLIK